MNPAAAINPVHGVVRLEIPARAEWVAVARLAVAAVISRQPFSVDEIEDVKLAVAESCTNAIQHGTREGTIEITCEARERETILTVTDRNMGPRTSSVDGERIGDPGRTEDLGVFLIRALMDDVDVTVDEREGTRIVMTKRVSG